MLFILPRIINASSFFLKIDQVMSTLFFKEADIQTITSQGSDQAKINQHLLQRKTG